MVTFELRSTPQAGETAIRTHQSIIMAATTYGAAPRRGESRVLHFGTLSCALYLVGCGRCCRDRGRCSRRGLEYCRADPRLTRARAAQPWTRRCGSKDPKSSPSFWHPLRFHIKFGACGERTAVRGLWRRWRPIDDDGDQIGSLARCARHAAAAVKAVALAAAAARASAATAAIRRLLQLHIAVTE